MDGRPKAAHRVAGMLGVANDLPVKLPGTLVRTDTQIAQPARRRGEAPLRVT